MMIKNVVAAVAIVFLTACGGGGSDSTTITPIPQTFVIETLAISQNLSARESMVNGKTAVARIAVSQSTPFPAKISISVSDGKTVVFESTAKSPEFNGPAISNATAYTATIPGKYIKPGISVTATLSLNGSQLTKSLTPVVGPELSLASITIVPLMTSDGVKPQIPTVQEIRNTVIKHLPVHDDIPIEVAAIQNLPFTMTDERDWTLALAEMTSIRAKLIAPKTSSNSIFYGMVAQRNSNTEGMAYVGSTIALGTSTPSEWSRVFTHEVGHLLSLKHAPCDATAMVDTQFPYSGGSIGNVVPFNVLTSLDEAEKYDVMGYCGGKWMSDYSYEKAAKNAESKWAAKAQPLSVKKEHVASTGFLIAISLTNVKVLSTSTFNPGSETAVTVVKNGNIVPASILEIDHNHEIHLWIEGLPSGNFSVSHEGKTIQFTL